jgi:hypothetical protein
VSPSSWLPDDEVFVAVEAGQNSALAPWVGAMREVAQVPDRVGWLHDFVPDRDHDAIHRVDVSEGTLAHPDDGFVPEVVVGGEKCCHGDSYEGPACKSLISYISILAVGSCSSISILVAGRIADDARFADRVVEAVGGVVNPTRRLILFDEPLEIAGKYRS